MAVAARELASGEVLRLLPRLLNDLDELLLLAPRAEKRPATVKLERQTGRAKNLVQAIRLAASLEANPLNMQRDALDLSSELRAVAAYVRTSRTGESARSAIGLAAALAEQISKLLSQVALEN